VSRGISAKSEAISKKKMGAYPNIIDQKKLKSHGERGKDKVKKSM